MNEMARSSDAQESGIARPLVHVDGVTLQDKTREHLVTATYRVSLAIHATDRLVLLGRPVAGSRPC